MRGELQNDNGEAEFKDELERHQRSESVVITLLSAGQRACDQRDRDQPGNGRPSSSKDRITDRTVYADDTQDFAQPRIGVCLDRQGLGFRKVR